MSARNDTIIPLNVVHRIVLTDPPTLDDFQPNAERGIEPRRPIPVEFVRLESGISVYRTMAQARRTARKYPPWFGGGYVARIVLPESANVRIERTTKSAGHYTLWADADTILSWVDDVEPVTATKEDHDGI